MENNPMETGHQNQQQDRINRYNEKIKTVFKETCINKALVDVSRVRELPRYIFEWLLSRYQENGTLTVNNEKKLFNLIDNHYPEAEKLEMYKYRILRDNETLHILNHYKVTIDARTEEYIIYFPFFSSETRNVCIDDDIIDENKGLLLNGLWGIATIARSSTEKKPFQIKKFSPVQIAEVQLDQFIQARSRFNLVEWVDLLINTMGLNPHSFPSVNEKMYLIVRLIPYVEPNFNLIEMGPKGTGKSFIHKNISTHSHVIGGGTITRAQLFYNLNTNSRGLLLTNDVVAFDDFSNIRVERANELMGKLKNYMNDGIIDVGRFRETANSSVVIMGNVNLNSQGVPANPFYFRNLPREMQESAFLDRISAFIPGWRLHRVRKEDISRNYGLIGDWFSEILHELRRRSNFGPHVSNMIHFTGGGRRDDTHMYMTATGLMKLLFPDKRMDIDDWHLIAKMAVNLRQRVLDQNARIDPEYQGFHLGYELIDV